MRQHPVPVKAIATVAVAAAEGRVGTSAANAAILQFQQEQGVVAVGDATEVQPAAADEEPDSEALPEGETERSGIEAAKHRDLLADFLRDKATRGEGSKGKAILRAAAKRGICIPGLGAIDAKDVEDVINAFDQLEGQARWQ